MFANDHGDKLLPLRWDRQAIACTSPIPAHPNFTLPPESLLGGAKV
jgi:hypothetical protein